MRGGKSSGEPRSNRNAVRQGLYSKEVLARETKGRDLCPCLRATINMIEYTDPEIRPDKI